MSLKKTNQIIDEFASQLFMVEGEVTDLLTHETMQNLNVSSQNTTGAIAVGSALLGQIGTAALANFAASDEGIEVSDFAIEVTDPEGLKHYFTGCFPVVLFKKGDLVKVVADLILKNTLVQLLSLIKRIIIYGPVNKFLVVPNINVF